MWLRPIWPPLSDCTGGKLCADQQEYLSWFCQTFAQECPPNAVSAINAMFRQWGHQFIYDEEDVEEFNACRGIRVD